MELNTDIILTILSLSHPYYNKGFLYVNRQINKIANNYRYQLLRIWCFPSLTIREITSKYPNVTIGQVIEASLYYYPIKDSLDYYPKLELLYNACNRKISNLDTFLTYNDDNQENNICSLILYKFNRITEYNIWGDTFFNSLKIVKLGFQLSPSDIDNGNGYRDIMSSFVLSLEETVELVIRLTGENFYPLTDFGASLCGQDNIEHLSAAGIVINMILGSKKISNILQRNNKSMQVRDVILSEDQRQSLQADETLCPIYSRYLNINSSLYIDANIKNENEVCLYALECGDILQYIIYRDEGYLIPELYRCWFAPIIEYVID